MHGTATYRCDDTRDCIIHFCPPDDEQMCSKHVEARNKLTIKFSASSWLMLINKCIEMHGRQNFNILNSHISIQLKSFFGLGKACFVKPGNVLVTHVGFPISIKYFRP